LANTPRAGDSAPQQIRYVRVVQADALRTISVLKKSFAGPLAPAIPQCAGIQRPADFE
jgi:hypothetical protein